jgi:SGNH hydrolase-like domain, acetyltransferase AlgX
VSKGAVGKLEILVPCLILAAFCCDVLGRFVSVEPIAFRADEVMKQFASPYRMGPMEPNRRYHSDRASGDLPTMANLHEYRVFRPQTFTTDENGFRNSTDPQRPPPSVLVLGSSFIYGSGSSDDQTFPARLEDLSGCITYNASGKGIWAESILELVRNRGMDHGLVIVESLERQSGAPLVRSTGQGRLAWLPYRKHLLDIYETMRARLSVSPFQLLFQRTYKSLQNDTVLPNIYKDRIAVRHLQNGRPMLFLREIEKEHRFAGIPQNVGFYAEMRDRLRAAGFDLAVVIVPDKLTVYGPLLSDPPPGWQEGAALLSELEQSARARGITVVNVAPALIAHARQALEHSETIYWSDDAHWNPNGIEIAAEAVVEALGLRARCQPAGGGAVGAKRP